MITIDDKILSFQKIINEDISEKAQKEIDEYVLETDKMVSKYKEKKYDEINRIKREYKSRLDSKSESMHSKMEKEGQDILLSANKAIYEEFFKGLKEKLKEKYSSQKGEQYLENTLLKIKDSLKNNDTVYLYDASYDRDRAIVERILPNISIDVSKNIKLGGFEVENSEKTCRINYSLDSIISEEYTNILTKLKKELDII
ncbi:hypothetical protein HMPREF1142_1283 [Peptostreptococcaceae bacterium AS15]|nr:hypothetical protein HMPREF1142_1283 [Peptostreptococcaceae bacterium AS15]